MKQKFHREIDELSDQIATANDLYISILEVLFFGDIFCPKTNKFTKEIDI